MIQSGKWPCEGVGCRAVCWNKLKHLEKVAHLSRAWLAVSLVDQSVDHIEFRTQGGLFLSEPIHPTLHVLGMHSPPQAKQQTDRWYASGQLCDTWWCYFSFSIIIIDF